jgi:hypothetical protein
MCVAFGVRGQVLPSVIFEFFGSVNSTMVFRFLSFLSWPALCRPSRLGGHAARPIGIAGTSPAMTEHQ